MRDKKATKEDRIEAEEAYLEKTRADFKQYRVRIATLAQQSIALVRRSIAPVQQPEAKKRETLAMNSITLINKMQSIQKHTIIAGEHKKSLNELQAHQDKFNSAEQFELRGRYSTELPEAFPGRGAKYFIELQEALGKTRKGGLMEAQEFLSDPVYMHSVVEREKQQQEEDQAELRQKKEEIDAKIREFKSCPSYQMSEETRIDDIMVEKLKQASDKKEQEIKDLKAEEKVLQQEYLKLLNDPSETKDQSEPEGKKSKFNKKMLERKKKTEEKKLINSNRHIAQDINIRCKKLRIIEQRIRLRENFIKQASKCIAIARGRGIDLTNIIEDPTYLISQKKKFYEKETKNRNEDIKGLLREIERRKVLMAKPAAGATAAGKKKECAVHEIKGVAAQTFDEILKELDQSWSETYRKKEVGVACIEEVIGGACWEKYGQERLTQINADQCKEELIACKAESPASLGKDDHSSATLQLARHLSMEDVSGILGTLAGQLSHELENGKKDACFLRAVILRCDQVSGSKQDKVVKLLRPIALKELVWCETNRYRRLNHKQSKSVLTRAAFEQPEAAYKLFRDHKEIIMHALTELRAYFQGSKKLKLLEELGEKLSEGLGEKSPKAPYSENLGKAAAHIISLVATTHGEAVRVGTVGTEEQSGAIEYQVMMASPLLTSRQPSRAMSGASEVVFASKDPGQTIVDSSNHGHKCPFELASKQLESLHKKYNARFGREPQLEPSFKGKKVMQLQLTARDVSDDRRCYAKKDDLDKIEAGNIEKISVYTTAEVMLDSNLRGFTTLPCDFAEGERATIRKCTQEEISHCPSVTYRVLMQAKEPGEQEACYNAAEQEPAAKEVAQAEAENPIDANTNADAANIYRVFNSTDAGSRTGIKYVIEANAAVNQPSQDLELASQPAAALPKDGFPLPKDGAPSPKDGYSGDGIANTL